MFHPEIRNEVTWYVAILCLERTAAANHQISLEFEWLKFFVFFFLNLVGMGTSAKYE